MYKLDFLGVTQTEYDILRLLRDAIANTNLPRRPSWYVVDVDTENHETAYHLCDGYDAGALLYATGDYMNPGFAFEKGISSERALRETAESKGVTTLHQARLENSNLYRHQESRTLPHIVVAPLKLRQILAEDPARIDATPYTRGIGGLIGVRDGDHPDDFYSRRNNTYHTLYGAITGNSGNELELGNLGDTCYACGKGIKFGIKEQYPLLTKEQQESVVGRAWGLLEALYKDIRSRRGDFSEIPSVDEVLMLVNGYGVFPEPEQVKGKKNERKLKATPKQHREVEASLQASESVDEDTRSHEEGNSKRKYYRGAEIIIMFIITLIWCTPLRRLVPGLENLNDGYNLLGALLLLLWNHNIFKRPI
jgi:hypothetical protein